MVRIVHDAGGVRGLIVVLDFFSEAVEKRLFELGNNGIFHAAKRSMAGLNIAGERMPLSTGHGAVIYFKPHKPHLKVAPPADPPPNAGANLAADAFRTRVVHYETYFVIEIELPRRSLYIMSGESPARRTTTRSTWTTTDM